MPVALTSWRGDPAALYELSPLAPARPAWHARAVCRGRPGFVAEGRAAREAAELCAGCPVRPECARSALDALSSGVWLVGTWAGVHLGTHGGRALAALKLHELAGG